MIRTLLSAAHYEDMVETLTRPRMEQIQMFLVLARQLMNKTEQPSRLHLCNRGHARISPNKLRSLGFTQIGVDTFEKAGKQTTTRVTETKGQCSKVEVDVTSKDVRVSFARVSDAEGNHDIASCFVGNTFAARIDDNNVSFRVGPVSYSVEEEVERTFLSDSIYLERHDDGTTTESIVGMGGLGVGISQERIDQLPANAFQTGYPLEQTIIEMKKLLSLTC